MFCLELLHRKAAFQPYKIEGVVDQFNHFNLVKLSTVYPRNGPLFLNQLLTVEPKNDFKDINKIPNFFFK